jgi:GTPase SAR1 family protein
MVAAEYFDLRSHLGAALFSLGRVAELAGLKPSRTPIVKSLVEDLRDPFVFVVAGEVNTGKSTLLNALFGEEFCPSSGLPETQHIHYFRYGRSPRRTTVSAVLEEIELPHSFLRDFHVVDTPGVNSIAEGHELITGEFIPRADAVLYCFPATNPWSGASWEFLERIHHDWLKKIVLVLQQADLRTPEEITAITEHMQAITRQRLGVALPVYPVSARLALLARTSGVDKVRLLAASAFPAFERQLTQLITETAPRLAKLVTACSAGQAILAEVQASLSAASASLTELTHLQQRVLTSVAAACGETRQQAADATAVLRRAWNDASRAALTGGLPERLAFPGMLLGRDPTAETIESRLLPSLMSAVRETAICYETQLGHTLATLQDQPGTEICRPLEESGFHPEEPATSRNGVFLTLLENAACDTVTQSGLASFWQDRLHRRQGMMRGLVLLGLVLAAVLTAGLVNGSLPPVAGWWLVVLGLAGAWTGRQILRRETVETAALAAPLLTAAGDQLSTSVRHLTTEYGDQQMARFDHFTATLETEIQQKQQALAPLTEEAGQLAASLQTLARLLHAGLASPETAAV